MHLTDHCITDLKSLCAVVKIARKAKHSHVTCDLDLFYQLRKGTRKQQALYKWLTAASIPYRVRWEDTYHTNNLIQLDIWPEELDPK